MSKLSSAIVKIVMKLSDCLLLHILKKKRWNNLERVYNEK